MLDLMYPFDGGVAHSYKVNLITDRDYKDAKHRLLFVMQTVLTDDLKAHQLISTKEAKHFMEGFIDQAKRLAKFHEKKLPAFRYAVVNFNDAKTSDLSGQKNEKVADVLKEKETAFAQRVFSIIKELKPTHVLVCGTSAVEHIFNHYFPSEENIAYKRGWVFETARGVKFTPCFDVFKLYQDKDKIKDYKNTIGFAFQHLANLMLGRNPFSLSHITPKAKYIESVADFDAMMEVLYQSKFVGYDLETRNVTVTQNAIYTMQFASNLDPETGYVLTLDHPATPWSHDELVYFKKTLRKFFLASGRPILITYNGMFDLRVTRTALKLPIINRNVWELMAGEHDLDENVNDLTQAYMGVPQGNLRACLCRYGNDFYFRNAFTKEDRETVGDIAPNSKDFLMYAAADAVFSLAIMRMQLRRSAIQILPSGESYKPYFINHMLNIMGPTAHILSHLKEDGSYIDTKYLKELQDEQISPLAQQLREIEQEIYSNPDVKKANALLLQEAGFSSHSLFGDEAGEQWILSLTKPEHKEKLFFDVLKLEPTVYSKKTGKPSVNKAFMEQYKYTNVVVSLFSDYQKITKLLSTYVKGWYNTLTLEDTDGIATHCLRPDYAFYNVLTGRLGSRNPSLQVIPQRGPLAPILKKAFVAPPGTILIHYDYSAQEVRTWGIASGDDVVADTFRVGQKLRQAYIKNPTKENKDKIKSDGDVHILNVKRFFNRVVDKKHPLRSIVKAVIFGAIYMMSAKQMGERIKEADIIDAKAKVSEAFKALTTLRSNPKVDPKELRAAEADLQKASDGLQAIIDEDRTDMAQSIMDKMFSEFADGRAWLDRAEAMAQDYGFSISPVGRIRHVPGVFVYGEQTVARATRQACNAPIQGFASELTVKASRLTTQDYYRHYKTIAKMLGLTKTMLQNKLYACRIVHDANYFAAPYEMVIPFIHIVQYQATYGTAQTIEKEFGVHFNIEPEIEMELGVCDSDEGTTWDWSISQLLSILDKEVRTGYERGIVTEAPDRVMEKILAPWRNAECRAYLQEHYPLLGVRDLDDTIIEALDAYDRSRSN